ncbi:hypothetical protein BJ138DRAFT_1154518 [Hygrophoropsis aurantiaca]|uniref:Uncharacterized protein n=1 Tax=Hygrophoropsis aurantiaca TaxID=72124 RepID=A0ACB8A9N7_9AGAM|nr:hypothetical protein BJ138DRAFT_1154518 [Hygrophoropsis aurantiaca]
MSGSKRPLSPPNSQGNPPTRAKLEDTCQSLSELFTIQDSTDPAKHEAMDSAIINEIKLMSNGDIFDPSQNSLPLILLLTVIVKHSESQLNVEYSENISAMGLLGSYPALKQELLKAWQAQSFKSIRCLEILQPSKVKPISPEKELDIAVMTQSRATELSWQRDFTGDAHESLWCFIAHHFEKTIKDDKCYARYTAIVQSSGTGKSRVVDQMSKAHFVIPMNLRDGYYGYPPPDEQVQKYLCHAKGHAESFDRACGFLTALFKQTLLVITNFSNVSMGSTNLLAMDTGDDQEKLAARFREHMAEGMTIHSHGSSRTDFYDAVVHHAEKETALCVAYRLKHTNASNSGSNYMAVSPTQTDIAGFPCYKALKALVKAMNPAVSPESPTVKQRPTAQQKMVQTPTVILAFDEAHTLTLDQSTGHWSNFTEMRRALRVLKDLPIFSLFLSTTGKISQFVPPRNVDLSSVRIHNYLFTLITPFVALGFDQLVTKLTFSDKAGIFDEFTSNKCIAYFGRPLFGTRFDFDDEGTRNHILQFAAWKLMGGQEIVPARDLKIAQKLACLSSRLPIEFTSTTYTHPEEMEQVADHMRYCLQVDPGLEGMTTVSPSEPLLSEAAYWIMQDKDFDAPRSLQTILGGFSVHKGDRGELLVMLLLTLARDASVGPPDRDGMPKRRWTTVPEFFSCLFRAQTDILNPSIGQVVGPNGVLENSMTFQKQFSGAHIYFNHIIKVHQQSFLDTVLLAGLFYRGTAVLCGSSQSAIDGIIPICMGDELKPENMSVILWQSKNDAKYTSSVQTSLFDSMDPFALGIFPKDNNHFARSTTPLIRIVFALAAKKPSIQVVRVTEGAADAFTTYDIWCAGLSPDIFFPINFLQTEVWASLLEATYGWRDIYKPDGPVQPDLIRSSNPGVAKDAGHWSWYLDALVPRQHD